MGAALDDASVVEHEDLIGVADRGQAVRDRDRGAPPGQLVERKLHGALGLGVERGGGLVEDQYGRVAKDRARDRDALLLAAGEAIAALADGRVVAVGQRGDELVDLRRPRRLLDLPVAGLRTGEAQILADGGVEEVGLLRDQAHRGGQRGERGVAYVDPVDAHAAALGLVQARDEVGERGLARAGLADQRGGRAGGDLGTDLAQRPAGALGVAKPHFAQAHVAAHALQRARGGALGDVDRQVQVLEDAPEQGQRGLDFEAHREQRLDGEQHARLQRGERHDRADRDRVPAGGDALAGEPVHGGGHDREAHLHGGHAPAPRHARAHLELGEFA